MEVYRVPEVNTYV